MKKPVIGIIGGTGQMGQWLKRFFNKQGYKILISGRKTKLKHSECAKISDVVIVCVPIGVTIKVIKEIGPYIRKEALLMDVTSLKKEPMKAMLKYAKASVLGTHPVFGPSVKTIKNQTVVLCKGRGEKWFKWAKDIFVKSGAKVKVTSAEKHDHMMAIIQGITHFSNICVGYAIKELGVNVKESLHYTSPIYKLRMDMVGRILNQDPRLYADIEVLNPETPKAIEAYIKATKKLKKIVEKKDVKGFIKFFNEAADFFGSFKKEAQEYSDYLIEKLVRKK